MLESIVKVVFPADAGHQHERQLTGDQQCALRYVSGYILRNIKVKAQQYRDEALTTLDDLSCENTGGSTDETFLSYSRRWVDLEGVVTDEVYTAMELALQEYEVPLESIIRMSMSPVLEMFNSIGVTKSI